MKAVILLAGLGTRLRPHTYSKPKPLVPVAGKPVLGHILDNLVGLKIEETIFIVGYLGEQIEKYVKEQYPKMRAHFVEQPEMNECGPQTVDGAALLVARLKRPVDLVECRHGGVEQLQHRDIHFGMAVIAGRIDERAYPATRREDVAAPQIAMQQGCRRARGEPV